MCHHEVVVRTSLFEIRPFTTIWCYRNGQRLAPIELQAVFMPAHDVHCPRHGFSYDPFHVEGERWRAERWRKDEVRKTGS